MKDLRNKEFTMHSIEVAIDQFLMNNGKLDEAIDEPSGNGFSFSNAEKSLMQSWYSGQGDPLYAITSSAVRSGVGWINKEINFNHGIDGAYNLKQDLESMNKRERAIATKLIDRLKKWAEENRVEEDEPEPPKESYGGATTKGGKELYTDVMTIANNMATLTKPVKATDIADAVLDKTSYRPSNDDVASILLDSGKFVRAHNPSDGYVKAAKKESISELFGGGSIFKFHTGPAWVHQQADKARKAGFKVTDEGTEHIYVKMKADSISDATKLMRSKGVNLLAVGRQGEAKELTVKTDKTIQKLLDNNIEVDNFDKLIDKIYETDGEIDLDILSDDVEGDEEGDGDEAVEPTSITDIFPEDLLMGWTNEDYTSSHIKFVHPELTDTVFEVTAGEDTEEGEDSEVAPTTEALTFGSTMGASDNYLAAKEYVKDTYSSLKWVKSLGGNKKSEHFSFKIDNESSPGELVVYANGDVKVVQEPGDEVEEAIVQTEDETDDENIEPVDSDTDTETTDGPFKVLLTWAKETEVDTSEVEPDQVTEGDTTFSFEASFATLDELNNAAPMITGMLAAIPTPAGEDSEEAEEPSEGGEDMDMGESIDESNLHVQVVDTINDVKKGGKLVIDVRGDGKEEATFKRYSATYKRPRYNVMIVDVDTDIVVKSNEHTESFESEDKLYSLIDKFLTEGDADNFDDLEKLMKDVDKDTELEGEKPGDNDDGTMASLGYDAGNYDSAYLGGDYKEQLKKQQNNGNKVFDAAYLAGWFSSFEDSEIPDGDSKALSSAEKLVNPIFKKVGIKSRTESINEETGEANDHIAQEIELYIDNTEKLYKLKMSAFKNLIKRTEEGTYTEDWAKSQFKLIVINALIMYKREIGNEIEDTTINKISKETKDLVYSNYLKEFESQYENGELDWLSKNESVNENIFNAGDLVRVRSTHGSEKFRGDTGKVITAVQFDKYRVNLKKNGERLVDVHDLELVNKTESINEKKIIAYYEGSSKIPVGYFSNHGVLTVSPENAMMFDTTPDSDIMFYAKSIQGIDGGSFKAVAIEFPHTSDRNP
jgi:hypothetical protein